MAIEENENIAASKSEIESTTKELEREIAKLRDPTVHASIMYAVVRERENTNRILKNLLARIDALEEKIAKLEEERHPIKRIENLPDIDQTIIDYIKKKGRATADDVQRAFRYKGKNAACARLSKLADFGFLTKEKVGKKVYYALTSSIDENKENKTAMNEVIKQSD